MFPSLSWRVYQTRPFPLTSKLATTKQTKVGIKEYYLIPQLEMLDLDLLIVSSFHLLLLELGAVVSLPPSFIQLSPLDLPFNPC